jgi:hypothetical protein
VVRRCRSASRSHLEVSSSLRPEQRADPDKRAGVTHPSSVRNVRA